MYTTLMNSEGSIVLRCFLIFEHFEARCSFKCSFLFYSQGAWVWHDEDELLKFSQYGYFEEFHERISAVTDIPSEVIVESEPLQVRHYEKGQFQVTIVIP